MKKHTPSRFAHATATPIVACDVGMDSIHLVCRFAGTAFPRVFAIDNRSEAIRQALTELRNEASSRGHTDIRLVLEPTGV